MKRLGRISLRIAAALLLLLLAGTVAAVLVFRSGWFQERVRERIVSEIERASGGRAELGSFRFDWAHLTATVSDLMLHGTERAGEPSLLKIDTVTVGLRIISMLERRVDIALLRLQHPVVHVIFYPDGSTNIPPRRQLNWAEKLVDFAVRHYDVDDGLIDYDDRKIPLNLHGDHLRAALAYESKPAGYRGDVESRNVRVTIAGFSPIEVDASAQFVLDKSRIQVTALRLASRQSRAELSGTLTDPRSPHGVFSVKATVAVRDAVDLFHLPLARAGSATFEGQLSIPDLNGTGRVAARGLGYSRDRLKIEGAAVTTALRISPERITLSAIKLSALGAAIDGTGELREFNQFHFDGNIGGLTLRAAAHLAIDRAIPWDGAVNGGFTVDATIGQQDAKVRVAAAITPVSEEAPLEGEIDALYDQAAGKLHVETSRLATRTTRVEASGTLGDTIEVRAESSSLEDVIPALAMLGQGQLPAKFTFGHAAFRGSVSGPLGDLHVRGDASVQNASIEGHAFDRFTGVIEADRRSVHVRNAAIARGPAEITGAAELAPPTADGAVSAQLEVRNASIQELAKEAGIATSVSGTASGSLGVSGALNHPQADAALQVEKPAGFGEEFDRLRAVLHYSDQAIEVSSADLYGAGGSLHVKGTFEHRPGEWNNGAVRFDGNAQGIALPLIRAYAALKTSAEATVEAKGSGTVRIVNGQPALEALDGSATARRAVWQGQALGDISLSAETRGAELSMHAASQIRDIKIDAQGAWRLEGDDPGSVTIRLSRSSAATLHSIVMAGGPLEHTELPFDGFLDGVSANVLIALRKPGEFTGELIINTLQLNPKPTQTFRLGVQGQDLVLRNTRPLSIAISSKEARIRSAQFIARDTSLEVTGAIPLDRAGSDLTVRGSVNLIILQLLNPDLAARGNATVQASIRGSLRDPQVSGRMNLNNASLYLGDLPNGVDNANGSVLFDRNRATIEKLTAETGGGKIDFAGFIGFGSPLVYRLQTNARNVRVRYPEDVSVTFNAALALNGTSDSSTVSGTVTFARAAFTPRADLAQVLAQAARPAGAEATGSEYLRGMQFDVRIESGPNFELQTSLTRNLEAEIDLRLRGTPLRPVLLGTFSVNEGEAEFLGNRYTVNRGDIRFINPVRIDPIFDLDLETKARGVTVNIAISGTLEKLNVNYSSDPPMQPREIIALLAVGRTPADTLGLNPAQSATTSSSSLAEAGGGLIGQAVTAQLSSRLQRFFGASRVKIDPTLTGVDYLPQARLTIEQQVSRDITLTYITNLNRTQEQIVQLQWDFSKQWSAVAVRDANGLFGIDFQYRKRFK